MKSFLVLFFLLMINFSIFAADYSVGLVTKEIQYQVDGTVLNGYLAYDASIEGKRPGILVVHEWWGHNDYARQRAKMLAYLGYTALALDMYGDGKQAAHPNDAKKFMMEVISNMPVAEQRFDAAYEILKHHKTVNAEKIAAVGYCFGGGIVLHMARFGKDLQGVVSFHGSLGTNMPAEKDSILAKIRVFTGAADPFIPESQVESFTQEMDNAGADYKVVSYPDVKHSFTNPEADAFAEKFNMPLAYDKAADDDSWQQTQRFFQEIFK